MRVIIAIFVALQHECLGLSLYSQSLQSRPDVARAKALLLKNNDLRSSLVIAVKETTLQTASKTDPREIVEISPGIFRALKNKAAAIFSRSDVAKAQSKLVASDASLMRDEPPSSPSSSPPPVSMASTSVQEDPTPPVSTASNTKSEALSKSPELSGPEVKKEEVPSNEETGEKKGLDAIKSKTSALTKRIKGKPLLALGLLGAAAGPLLPEGAIAAEVVVWGSRASLLGALVGSKFAEWTSKEAAGELGMMVPAGQSYTEAVLKVQRSQLERLLKEKVALQSFLKSELVDLRARIQESMEVPSNSKIVEGQLVSLEKAKAALSASLAEEVPGLRKQIADVDYTLVVSKAFDTAMAAVITEEAIAESDAKGASTSPERLLKAQRSQLERILKAKILELKSTERTIAEASAKLENKVTKGSGGVGRFLEILLSDEPKEKSSVLKSQLHRIVETKTALKRSLMAEIPAIRKRIADIDYTLILGV